VISSGAKSLSRVKSSQDNKVQRGSSMEASKPSVTSLPIARLTMLLVMKIVLRTSLGLPNCPRIFSVQLTALLEETLQAATSHNQKEAVTQGPLAKGLARDFPAQAQPKQVLRPTP
jgi:hypothetical protein